MNLQVGVKVLLQNPEGKYLLLKRNPEKYPEAGEQWDIVGGRIEPGTPLLENLQREVREETGLDLDTDKVKLVAAQDILHLSDKHIVRLTYVGKISGDPVLDTDHTEYGWFTLGQIRNLPQLDTYFKQLLDQNVLKD